MTIDRAFCLLLAGFLVVGCTTSDDSSEGEAESEAEAEGEDEGEGEAESEGEELGPETCDNHVDDNGNLLIDCAEAAECADHPRCAPCNESAIEVACGDTLADQTNVGGPSLVISRDCGWDVTGPEVYYHLPPLDEAMAVTIRVTSHSLHDFDLFISEGDTCQPETCVFSSGTIIGEVLTFLAEADTHYWIVVDGFPTGLAKATEGSFDLAIECGTPDDFCGSTPIACGDTVSGDNTGAGNRQDTYGTDVKGGCGTNETLGPEDVYELTVPDAGDVTVTLDAVDPNLFPIALAADGDHWCGALCEAMSTTVDRFFTFTATAGGRYFIVVDGLGQPEAKVPGATSAYDLTIDCAGAGGG